MRYIIVSLIVLLFSACSPKYKVVKEYKIPEASTNSIKSCQYKRDSCKTNCQAKFASCRLKADRVAKERYEQKMKIYVKELEDYAREVEMYELEMELNYFEPFGYPYCRAAPFYGGGFYRGVFWRDPRMYIGAKPQKPSLEQERLKAQSEICQLDCGCERLYDDCFMSHGGKIINKKICIKNCPDDK